MYGLRRDLYIFELAIESNWSTQTLRQKCPQVVHQHASLLVIQNHVVLVGDGMKQAKDGR
ncbi:hypothetical protein FHR92_004400 [Fontibacillus solani]|uniref:Uncharacterized protein n=1 Tax=Fontibacillus solani TaxID=1572857 RepID=A0A7W3SXA8_9BACL|nr:hypothetical protein [Fontibacillus solani]